jgi:hypothetical protein
MATAIAARTDANRRETDTEEDNGFTLPKVPNKAKLSEKSKKNGD